MKSAKDEILERIQSANHEALVPRQNDYAAIVRSYPDGGRLDSDARLHLFEDRLRDYEAGVYRSAQAAISETIAQVLKSRDKKSLLVPSGVDAGWLPEPFTFVRSGRLSYDDLDGSEGVLTGCALGIALTGTIVLRHSEEEGSRAVTLIPDYHLCVVYADQVVETVIEGIRRMSTFGAVPLTTISGPSATADIEMTRVKGVHGPRTLDVILVDT